MPERPILIAGVEGIRLVLTPALPAQDIGAHANIAKNLPKQRPVICTDRGFSGLPAFSRIFPKFDNLSRWIIPAILIRN